MRSVAFKLEFSTANAAFQDGEFEMESHYIVLGVAEAIREGRRSGKVRDTNGNTVGEWELTEEDK